MYNKNICNFKNKQQRLNIFDFLSATPHFWWCTIARTSRKENNIFHALKKLGFLILLLLLVFFCSLFVVIFRIIFLWTCLLVSINLLFVRKKENVWDNLLLCERLDSFHNNRFTTQRACDIHDIPTSNFMYCTFSCL